MRPSHDLGVLPCPLPLRRNLQSVLVISALSGLFLAPLPPQVTSNLILQAALDGLHVPAFALITASTHRLLQSKATLATPLRPLVCAALLASAATLVVEAVQIPVGRSASWADVGLGLAGVGIATGASWPLQSTVRLPALAFLAITGICCQALPLLQLFTARQSLERQLPALGHDPQSGWSERWQPQHGAAISRESSRILVRTGPGPYGGLSFWAGGQDWSRYETLELQLSNHGAAFVLGVRIDDTDSGTAHDNRFNGELHLPPGSSHHVIPLAKVAAAPKRRPLNLRSIHRLALFSSAVESRQSFSLQSAILR